MTKTFYEGRCIFSNCGEYRYDLERVWDSTKSLFLIIMLNPSTATAKTSDPTTEKCLHYARKYNHGQYTAVNLFAFRSPMPKVMKASANPKGHDTDFWINYHLGRVIKQKGSTVVVAWGNDGQYQHRDEEIMEMLSTHGIIPLCFGTNKNGTPKHPTYLAKDLELIPYIYGEAHD